jgi:hypothetical protein
MRWLFPLVAALAVLAGGCVKAKAHVEPAMPTLVPPPPPPRVVGVYPPPEEPEPAVAPAPVEPDTEPPPPPRRRPGNRSDNASRPEPAPAEPETRPAAPPPTLTLKPPSGSEAKTEASIRGLLERAGRDLSQVNVGALDPDGRTQYDTARRFLQQAEEALKTRNYVFAGKLADKAATMAAVLVR